MNKIVNGVANDYEFPELDWVHHDSKTFDDEKFIEDIERKYIEKHTTHIKVYTEDYVKSLLQQITQLTNNWNELEEDINNKIKDIKTNFSQVNGNYFNMNYVIDTYEEVLDKMKEIKEGNNE